MPFAGSQVALNSSTPTPLWTWETGQGGTPLSGRVDDPIPISIVCASPIYLGGSGVSASGYLLAANTPLNLQVFGALEILYALAETGTPTVYVLMGRQ